MFFFVFLFFSSTPPLSKPKTEQQKSRCRSHINPFIIPRTPRVTEPRQTLEPSPKRPLILLHHHPRQRLLPPTSPSSSQKQTKKREETNTRLNWFQRRFETEEYWENIPRGYMEVDGVRYYFRERPDRKNGPFYSRDFSCCGVFRMPWFLLIGILFLVTVVAVWIGAACHYLPKRQASDEWHDFLDAF